MRNALIALTAALALLLTACGQGTVQPTPQPDPTPTPTQTPQQIPFSLPYQSGASLHPITGNNRTNQVLSSLVYQGLFELDNTFTPSGVLCSGSSVSPDSLTWTFTLGDARFSDGSALTAGDVVSSLELARTSELYAARLADVERISAQGGDTVVITLSQPNGNLPALLDIPVIRATDDGSMPLGTGPYAFAEDSGAFRLVRRDGAPSTAPQEIPLFAVEAADDLIYAFDAGEISLVTSDLTGSNALGFSSGYEAFDYPTTTMLYVGFQNSRGYCRDARVRQALSLAFDRATVTGSLLAGHAQSTGLPFSPHSPLYSTDHESSFFYDPDRAASMLSDAGYNTAAMSLTFIVNTDNPFKLSVAEYLTESLTRLGISVELKKLAWADYTTALNQGNFDLYLGEVALTADFDLTHLLAQNGSLNFGGCGSGEGDALLEALRSANGEAAAPADTAFLDWFCDEVPVAPLCFKEHSVLIRWQAVSGLAPTRQNPFYHLESLRFGAET